MSRWIRDRDKYEKGSKWFADWHRNQDDDSAGMIDLDGVGFCRQCSEPLYLVEATEGKTRKNATVTERLGELARLEVFVFYRDDSKPAQILVDWRSAGINLGWVAEQQAWLVLLSIRNSHRCAGLAERTAS